MALTAKQRRFVAEYLLDLNATQAAIRAGYSKNRASEIGYQLLQKPDITSAIQAAMKERAERTQIDADYVLRRMIEIDQMDLLDIMTDAMELKPVSQWPRVWRQYLSGFDLAEMFEGRGDEREMIGFLKKIKWPDKVKNLELLGRHFGMFKERVEHSGSAGGPIAVAAMTKEDYKQARKEMLAEDDC
ncbi:TPA: terminase small subunit [Pseudomonas aeruginosa]